MAVVAAAGDQAVAAAFDAVEDLVAADLEEAVLAQVLRALFGWL